ncbi:hypothetical protein [Treponema pedis]|uniref:hypothetical protein n=1 Tax=Treponema pedis TaxID=409322 RepID=UPI003D23CEC6
MKRRGISYFRKQLDYKNVVGHGEITEFVIFTPPPPPEKNEIHTGKPYLNRHLYNITLIFVYTLFIINYSYFQQLQASKPP